MFFNRFLSGSLRAAEGDQSAAGAGTGESNSGADQKSATFDQDAFKKSIFDEFNKTLNGFAKNLKNDFTKFASQQKPPEQHQADQDQQVDAAAAAKDGKSGDKPNPEVAILTRELKKLQDLTASLQEENKRTKETAQKKEADSILRAEISKHQLVPGAADDLFDILSVKIKRDDNGRLYAGDDANLDVFVKDYLEARPHYLPPVNVNGAGSGRNASHPTKSLDWDTVKPGASADIMARAKAEIAAVLAQQPKS